jgi:hypothetical protein
MAGLVGSIPQHGKEGVKHLDNSLWLNTRCNLSNISPKETFLVQYVLELYRVTIYRTV